MVTSWLLACTCLLSLAHQVQQSEGLNSKGASTPVGRYQVGGVVWAGETGAALDFGQNSRMVLRGQHRGTAVGTLFCLTAHVGFLVVLFLFFAFFFLFFCFSFFILMHAASIWTRLVGGEVFGSHAGSV